MKTPVHKSAITICSLNNQKLTSSEDNVVCLYSPFLADVVADPALTTGTSVSGVQFEEWPEAGFDSYTYHRFMVEQGKLEQAKASNRLSSEQTQCYPEDNVVCLYAPFGPSSGGNLLVTDQNEVWPEIDSGTPIHHLVKYHLPKQGKVGSVALVDPNEVWSEIEDTPVFHLMNQLNAGTHPSINGVRCYPEDNC
jgi:hypothetical protein